MSSHNNLWLGTIYMVLSIITKMDYVMMIYDYLVEQSNEMYWRVVKFAAASLSYLTAMTAMWFNM